MQETQEMQVQSPGWEDTLEKGRATHSSILAWRIPWTKEPADYSPWGCRVRHFWSDWAKVLFQSSPDIFLFVLVESALGSPGTGNTNVWGHCRPRLYPTSPLISPVSHSSKTTTIQRHSSPDTSYFEVTYSDWLHGYLLRKPQWNKTNAFVGLWGH